jgi:hypothetical protein
VDVRLFIYILLLSESHLPIKGIKQMPIYQQHQNFPQKSSLAP